jgi:hypothetical protein
MQQQKKLTEGEACSGSPEGEKVWWGSSIIGEGGKIIQEDHEFIVTRATSAIALHLLRTDPTQRHRSQSGL